MWFRLRECEARNNLEGIIITRKRKRKMMKRVFLIVLDSFGIGEMPDAELTAISM